MKSSPTALALWQSSAQVAVHMAPGGKITVLHTTLSFHRHSLLWWGVVRESRVTETQVGF